MSDRVAVRAWLAGLHESLVAAIERADGGARFSRDRWERPGGGGGSRASSRTARSSNRAASTSPR